MQEKTVGTAVHYPAAGRGEGELKSSYALKWRSFALYDTLCQLISSLAISKGK